MRFQSRFTAYGSHPAVTIWMLAAMLAAGTAQLLAGGRASHPLLLIATAVGCIPLAYELARNLACLKFNVDLLAALSVVSAFAMRQDWVAAVVVLMLSGGKTLEDFATGRASSMLSALAKRMPQTAHRVSSSGSVDDIELKDVCVGDTLSVYPHELCPVDGAVVAGNGHMDESYLTGEPFLLAKAPGATVLSGAINGEAALTIKATRVASDSRYAKIVQILRDSELNRPRMRRIADRIAEWYTPAILVVAVASWIASGDPERFLAVLVIATPCPLLLAIPIAILGAVSIAARRGIVIKDPAILEKVGRCHTLIVDKTGTLTYGKPELNEVICLGEWGRSEILRLAASLEQYSKHPLGTAILAAARSEHIRLSTLRDVFEIPGHGVTAHAEDHIITITGRSQLPTRLISKLPDAAPGLESIVLVDGRLGGLLRFRDTPRPESKSFLGHVRSRHGIRDVVLLSGDRVAEVESFARLMEIATPAGGKSPEEKLAIVRTATAAHPTLYLGDGINDAPAMMSATVGVAMGANSEITSEAAGAVILSSSLGSVDELIHIGARMRSIALTSAIGGMSLSAIGVVAGALGYLRPIQGAILQECIDVLSILYALRIAMPRRFIGDFANVEATGLPEDPQMSAAASWSDRANTEISMLRK
ncbi:cadmium-translocating P-type ATPase [Acidobacteria bacterium AB60]|nr:cadmium-translocating P-type ATPase [Acidobacteria bacterium AB60]